MGLSPRNWKEMWEIPAPPKSFFYFLGGFMNNFKVIYKILKLIEASMDFEEFDEFCISPENLGISKERWKIIMNELVNEGYIKGVSLIPIVGSSTKEIKIIKPILTLKGMEYMEENSMMKKAANVAKGIIDIVK